MNLQLSLKVQMDYNNKLQFIERIVRFVFECTKGGINCNEG